MIAEQFDVSVVIVSFNTRDLLRECLNTLAAEAGGNCALTRPGESFVTDNGVTILGYRNWPGRIPVAASSLPAIR